jgi:hypothetical protein
MDAFIMVHGYVGVLHFERWDIMLLRLLPTCGIANIMSTSTTHVDQYGNRDQYEDIRVNGVRVNGVTIFIVITIVIVTTIFIVITINSINHDMEMIRTSRLRPAREDSVDSERYRARLQSDRIWEERSGGCQLAMEVMVKMKEDSVGRYSDKQYNEQYNEQYNVTLNRR